MDNELVNFDRSFGLDFSEFANKNPNLIALVCGVSSMTYRELEESSNRIARYLLKKGVNKGQFIGVLYERKINYLAMMIAILKIGAVYVPLDPNYPIDRLEYMVENSGVCLVLTSAKYVELCEKIGGSAYIDIDSVEEKILKFDSSFVMTNLPSSSDLMYVVYTSGSTGRPKGVMIKHSSALNLAKSHQDRCYDLVCNKDRSTCLWTPFSFDVSIEHILTLLYGHTLHIIDYHVSRDPQALLEYIDNNKITVLCVSPSYLAQLYSSGFETKGKSLELVVLGGEKIGKQLWRKVALDYRSFYNFYGPTETTIDATCTEISLSIPPDVIGRSLNNTKVYILDESGEICPPGVEGEIYISGCGVAKGYVNNEKLTKERFVNNPYSNEDQYSVMYKTGDIAITLESGQIKIVGRADNQVKVRGYRVELDEIEVALKDISSVKDVCVLVTTDETPARILSFVLLEEGMVDVDESLLKKELESTLPDYMIPMRILIMESFPLTINGKMDKKRLLSDFTTTIDADTHEGDMTFPYDELKSMWAETFFDENIDPDASFRDLGGDSFLAIKIARSIENQFSVDFSVKELYEFETIRKISEYIAKRGNSN